MGLVLAYVVRILHDDWSIRLGENRPDRVLKHLAAMLSGTLKFLTNSLRLAHRVANEIHARSIILSRIVIKKH